MKNWEKIIFIHAHVAQTYWGRGGDEIFAKLVGHHCIASKLCCYQTATQHHIISRRLLHSTVSPY